MKKCPYGFGHPCTFTSGVVLQETLTSFDLVHFQSGSNPSNYFPFNSGQSDDPLPMKQRGIYLNSSKFIKSIDEVNLHHTFTITLWLRTDNHGVLLKKGDYLVIDTGGSNGNDGMTLKLEDSDGNETNERLTFTFGISHWHYAAFTCEFSSPHGTTLKRYLDGTTSVINTPSYHKIFRHPAGHHIQVGGFECSALIYKIRILQEVDIDIIGDDDICTDSFAGGCLWNCDYNQYWDGTTCLGCGDSCDKGCVSASDCSLLPENCDAFSSLNIDGCTDCSSNYYLTEGICLKSCPTGFTQGSETCELSDCFAFHLKLGKVVSDIVYDERNSIPVLTGKDNSFYPNYDPSDPLAAGEKGYYFNGVSSYMQLPPHNNDDSKKLLIAPKFTMVFWTMPKATHGVLFEKADVNYLANPYIRLEIYTDQLALYLGGNFYQLFNTVTLDQWSFLVFRSYVEYSNYKISFSVNGNSEVKSLGDYFYEDPIDQYACNIGAIYNSPSSRGLFFHGFLWEFRIYNTEYDPSDLLQTSDCIGECTYCPVNNLNRCLPICSIDESCEYEPSETEESGEQEILESDKEIESLVQGGAIGSLVVGATVSLLASNPSGLWLMVNTIQLLTYIPISSNPLTPSLRGFFKGLNLAIKIPSIFDILIKENESPNPNKYSSDYGFESGLFLINAGFTVMILCILLVMWPFFWVLSRSRILCFQKVCKFLLEKYKFTLLLRLWIQSYLDISIACFIQLSFFSSSERLVVNNIIAAVVVAGLLIATPVTIGIFFHRKKDQLDSITEDSTIYKEYGTLFYELKYKKFKACLTYFFFTLQRLLFAASLIFLGNYPYLQASINCAVMLLFAGFVIIVRPYKDKTMQIVSMFVESGTFLIFLGIIYFLKNDPKDHEGIIEATAIYSALGVTLLRMLSVFLKLGSKIYEYFKQKNIARVQPEVTVIETTNYQETTHNTAGWILNSDYPVFARVKNQLQNSKFNPLSN